MSDPVHMHFTKWNSRPQCRHYVCNKIFFVNGGLPECWLFNESTTYIIMYVVIRSFCKLMFKGVLEA
jgi:hypothetical protein